MYTAAIDASRINSDRPTTEVLEAPDAHWAVLTDSYCSSAVRCDVVRFIHQVSFVVATVALEEDRKPILTTLPLKAANKDVH